MCIRAAERRLERVLIGPLDHRPRIAGCDRQSEREQGKQRNTAGHHEE
jgi:hypothetical protein